MPMFDYMCPTCEKMFEEFASAGADVFCSCGAKASRLMSFSTNFIIPDYMRAESDTVARAKHRAWMDSDKTRARIRSGELETAPKGEE